MPKTTDVNLVSPRRPSSTPHMPHERDEAVDATGGAPSARVQQAAHDVQRGVKDTSRAAEADATYRTLKKR